MRVPVVARSVTPLIANCSIKTLFFLQKHAYSVYDSYATLPDFVVAIFVVPVEREDTRLVDTIRCRCHF